jgi:hypothetical protein
MFTFLNQYKIIDFLFLNMAYLNKKNSLSDGMFFTFGHKTLL